MYKETPAQRPTNAQSNPAAPEISYTVSMSKPWTHLLEVEMRVRSSQMPPALQLKMPVWTPGSYLIREYERHVQDFDAKNASGAALTWDKVNKNTWQIDTKGSHEVVATYRVYANELTVRTNELNDEHAFWNNAALLMFPKDQLKAPSVVTVNPYSNWKVATGLPSVAGRANTFRAENYDILYDSPFEVSNFKEITFNVQGKPHRYVMSGDGNYDLNRLAADTTKIVEEAYKIFGELPYDNYTFIVNLRGGGGLEHLNSTALQFDRFGFKPESRYKQFLGLVAHEYFHLWNVKRLRPDALGPFDYENENYTKLLWTAEGGTEYYATVLLKRAGFTTDKEFLENKASGIAQLQRTPGRFETSLEDASFNAWIKYYRQDENSVNNQISYYDKGEIVDFLLDVTIRTASNGTKSLDDVMRYLYNEFYKKGRNYTPQDFQKAAEMAAGRSLDDFFSKYVRGTDEIDYNSIVSGIGLKLVAEQGAEGRAYLGVDMAEDNGRLTVRSLTAGTPAYEQGLNTGDQIVAIDGYRASTPRVQSFVAAKKPGDKVRLTIFRFDKLRDMDITLGSDTRKDYNFVPIENASDTQKRLYREYMNNEL
ncbi:MAG TPA: PDZ domain-containing protein [Pyrinomonadaceae bacterium]|nr:PDZ domain-containing protein [Pyrinomonadaceae bacterium]